MALRARRRLRRSFNHNQRGFSMVAVVLVGLLMLLLGLTSVARSQSDLMIAKSLELKTRSLSLAEAAAATYQSLLIEYPVLATHNGDRWAEPASLVTQDANCTPNPTALNGEEIKRIKESANTEWQNIDPQDPLKGQIRLVDYQFQPDDPSKGANVPPGTATLRVEGRANYRGLGLLNRPAVSQIALNFRVDANPVEKFIIGLWAKDFQVSGSNITINANVCDTSGKHSSDVLKPFLGTLPSGEPAQIVYGSPTLPPPPLEGQSLLRPDPSVMGDAVFDLSPKIQIQDLKTCTLPMLGAQQNCPVLLNEGVRSVYKYNIISPNPTDPKQPAIKLENLFFLGYGSSRFVLGKSGKETIILYIEGNIEANNAKIEVTPGTKVIIYHRKGSILTKAQFPSITKPQTTNVMNDMATQAVFKTSGLPENLQIYSYESSQRIAIENGSYSDPSEAFVYAPNAEVSIEQDTRVDGAIWTNRWLGKNRSMLTQRIEDPGALKIEVPATNRIHPPSSWQQRPSGW